MMKNASSATYSGGPPPRMRMHPRTHPATAPETSTPRIAYPPMANTVLTTIHGHAIGGGADSATIGLMAIAASTAAAMDGTVTLSSIPSGSVSAIALTISAAAMATSCGAPNTRAIPNAATPPKRMNAAKPPHDFAAFHGSGATGIRFPITVPNPSPNAISTHATAAISMCQLKTTTSTSTANG